MPTIAGLFKEARERWAFESARFTEGEVRQGLHEGRYGLRTRTGNLANRTDAETLSDSSGFRIGTSVRYGRAWELGFDRKAYTVTARGAGAGGADALMIPIGGQFLKSTRVTKAWSRGSGVFRQKGSRNMVIFRRRVHIPAATFSARPWLEPAIQAALPQLEKNALVIYAEALNNGLKRITVVTM